MRKVTNRMIMVRKYREAQKEYQLGTKSYLGSDLEGIRFRLNGIFFCKFYFGIISVKMCCHWSRAKVIFTEKSLDLLHIFSFVSVVKSDSEVPISPRYCRCLDLLENSTERIGPIHFLHPE